MNPTIDYDPTFQFRTKRLVLRPTVPNDVERALEIRSNREVAHNLVAATLPPDPEKMTKWFSGHAEEWRQGTAYRLAITLNGRLIGVCDVFDITGGEGEIGYWRIGRPGDVAWDLKRQKDSSASGLKTLA